MSLPKRLKESREGFGMTQAQVAEMLHVTRQTVSKWENGVNDPDIGTIVRLCDLYGVTLDWLLREDSTLVRRLARKERTFGRLVITAVVLAFLLLVLAAVDIRVGPGDVGGFLSQGSAVTSAAAKAVCASCSCGVSRGERIEHKWGKGML
jgi:transcriptional regulator with XRE-family HTH domain